MTCASCANDLAIYLTITPKSVPMEAFFHLAYVRIVGLMYLKVNKELIIQQCQAIVPVKKLISSVNDLTSYPTQC